VKLADGAGSPPIRTRGEASSRHRRAHRGAAPSTAQAWLAGTRKPTGERAERLIELSALVERLQRVMDTSYIPMWLRRPIEALDDRKPLDLLADGDFREVARVVSSLEDAPFD
jgi:Antitoxin Xre/MbcA/ParS C-terminal toxin-binding domain